MMGRWGAVIVAAGKGSRMRQKVSKQYLQLGDKPILAHTLETFRALTDIDEIVVVTGAGDVDRVYHLIQEHSTKRGELKVVEGGEDRQSSVYHGLRSFSANIDWVMVHDGVRPFASPEIIHKLMRETENMSTGGAVLAVPVKDTIKQVGKDGMVQSTPDRQSLWAIQTPQAFRYSDLLKAHETAEKDRFKGTDDAMLMEHSGHGIRIVMGDYNNIKITTPEDLLWSEWILGNARGEQKIHD